MQNVSAAWASCFDHGDGVAEDVAEAARLYLLAVELGLAVAQLNIGYAFMMSAQVDSSNRSGMPELNHKNKRELAFHCRGLMVSAVRGRARADGRALERTWL